MLGINVDEEGTDLITELLQISVMDVNELTGNTYVPQLNASGLLVGANITLPSELLLSGRRVANTVLLRDTLFVFNLSSPNEQMLGNLFISASLQQSVKNLSEPVIIEFYLSDVSVSKIIMETSCRILLSPHAHTHIHRCLAILRKM